MNVENPTKRRPVILTLVAHYLPGYKAGGPIRSISNLVAALSNTYDFRIITSDRDLGDKRAYSGLNMSGWNTVGAAQVLYLGPERKTLRNLTSLIRNTEHDVLYLNSFFNPFFSIAPLLARRLGLLRDRRYVLAPRGEFSPDALRLKQWKKIPFLTFARRVGLYQDLIWQASSTHEEAAIRKVMCGIAQQIQIAIAPDVTMAATPPSHIPRVEGGPVRLCFLSRISPMKNLVFALRLLSKVRVPMCFNIYGPIEDIHYWSECCALLAQLPAHVQARYRGCCEHSDVPAVFASHDVFFLPTLGENYGHVIAESLMVGTPVLIADTTPWRGLKGHGVGWDLPLSNQQAFIDVIEEVARMGPIEYAQMRARVVDYSDFCINGAHVVEANRRLFDHK